MLKQAAPVSVRITFFGIILRQKINLYINTKSVFTNQSKYYFRVTVRKLLSTEVLLTLIDTEAFRVIIKFIVGHEQMPCRGW